MDRADAEAPAKAGPVALGIEVFCDLLDAHRSASSIAVGTEIEHQADDLGLDGIDDDALLGPVAAFLDLLQGEAKRNA